MNALEKRFIQKLKAERDAFKRKAEGLERARMKPDPKRNDLERENLQLKTKLYLVRTLV